MVVSLGSKQGIVEYGNFVIGGFIGGLAKWFIEKLVMFGYK